MPGLLVFAYRLGNNKDIPERRKRATMFGINATMNLRANISSNPRREAGRRIVQSLVP
jgi:glycerol uptake facilitator-like aquaporin